MTEQGNTNSRSWGRLLIVLLLSVVVFIVIDAFELFENLVPGQSDGPQIERIRLLLSIIFWPLAPLGVYVVYFGYRVLKAGQFPPPGSWTIRQGTTETGKAAMIRGWAAIATGLCLCGLAIYGAVIIPAELTRL